MQSVEMFRQKWDSKKHAAAIRILLKMITQKIVCTPIKDKRTGEHVEIIFKPPGHWLGYFMRIHADWPYVGEVREEMRKGQLFEAGLRREVHAES